MKHLQTYEYGLKPSRAVFKNPLMDRGVIVPAGETIEVAGREVVDGAGNVLPSGLFGVTFYVDGTNGEDDNDGKSPSTAFATMQKACDASTAAHAANPNVYLQNVIHIAPRGGGTAQYAPITTMPNYTSFVGHGANPKGNGTGIVSIAGDATTDAVTGSFRGCKFFNILFEALDGQNCFYAPSLILRSGWYNCAFMGKVDEITAPNAGILCDGPFAGNDLIGCVFGTNESPFVTGVSLAVANGGAMNNNKIDDCTIIATTVGLTTGSVGSDYGSVMQNCHVGGSAPEGNLAKGIDINSEFGDWVIKNNTVVAVDAIEYTNNANRSVFRNDVINGTTPAVETAAFA